MESNSVYKVLQDVFPQIDARMLRAVAIEHTKDPDTAVEVVLNEVIPFLSKKSDMAPASTSSGSGTMLTPIEAMVKSCSTTLENDVPLADSTVLDEPPTDSVYFDANGGHDRMSENNSNCELVSEDKCGECSINVTLSTPIHENGSNDDRDEEFENSDNEDCILLRKPRESSVRVGSERGSHTTSITLKHEDNGPNGSMNDYLPESLDSPANDIMLDADEVRLLGQSHLDSKPVEVKNDVFSIPECMHDAAEDNLQLEVVPKALTTDPRKPDPSNSVDSSKDMFSNQHVDHEDDFGFHTVVTRSGRSCSIDVLEDHIADAKNIKKTMFTAMESILRLMGEVELQETAAEQAKEEAAKGNLDLLGRKEDLEQMLCHATEANDMRAGEVYGERAILATEVRDLQSRLLSLSEGRDTYLAILDEMRQTLEVRLAAARKEWEEVELERPEKEEYARKELAKKEIIMQRVVQESKVLQKEAEENSKLREFLMDRGHIVDMLQGEISIICQDVKLLKEKFNEQILLDKSVSSSQTSFFLPSSSSLLKSMVSDPTASLEVDSSEDLKKTSSILSVDDQCFSGDHQVADPTVSLEAESCQDLEKTSSVPFVDDQFFSGDHLKELEDDGWELFDEL